MKLRLPGRVPFRLRVFFRGTFLLLALATVALALSVLAEEKQLALRNYEEVFNKNQAQIAARLAHPTGQLALLNPEAARHPVTPLRPWVLPFSAIDFDDKAKVQQAVEMAGCLVQYADAESLCVAVGNNPFAGGFLYLAGSFASGALAPHVPGELDLALSHRVRVTLQMRAQTWRWIAPFETTPEAPGAAPGVRGRLTGFADDGPITPASRPVRDFRGWLWQDGRCLEAGAEAGAGDCRRQSFFSIRLPVEVFREALFQKARLVWPPSDLGETLVHLQVLAPGDAAPLFDSDDPRARRPFSLADLTPLLLPGEELRVRKLDAQGRAIEETVALAGIEPAPQQTPRWLERLVRKLPAAGPDRQGFDRPLESRSVISTPTARYELLLTGDARTASKSLAAVATRISWFVGAMLAAIVLTWLAIEIRIIRRITLLTKRAASVSREVRAAEGLARIELGDLRVSGDELGVLAQALHDLLQRVNEDLRRERIRAEQEKDTWHAVGHEIMSPLQSLLALHPEPADASHRYISRMQQAVRVLYGSASPSEAFQSTTLQPQPIDANAFFAHVAGNASFVGIADVRCTATPVPLMVRADDHSLEDVVTHVLRNADRYRPPGSPITITLQEAGTEEARVRIHNEGPPIAEAMLDRIFEYGVSDAPEGVDGHRGQGLFVARTYMAKMGGTIVARNAAPGGVEMVLTLQRAATPKAT